MRAVLTRSARPRIGRPHVSGIPVRKTVFSPARRKLTFCDAFTILLAPVLTAAFVADITRKDSRRQQWDRKIAEIQEEIELLRENGAKRWNALQLRSVHAGAACQRRTYTTASTTTQVRDEDFDLDLEACLVEPDTILSAASGIVSDPLLPRRLTDFERYENCIAVKAGLQLMLHMRYGRDTRGMPAPGDLENSILSTDGVDALLHHLSHINQNIRQLREKVTYISESERTDTKDKLLLDEKIASLAQQCRTGDISIPDLIYRYTQAVMDSGIGPSVMSYRRLIETLSTLDAEAMVFISLELLKNTKQVLTDHAMWTMIYQYGMTKSFARLDKFLLQLVEGRGTVQTTTQWDMVSVAGVRVPAPRNRHPILLDVLVRSALQNDRPHRAQAWAILLLQRGHFKAIARVFNSFLTYCSEHLDWATGQLWLSKTIMWAALFAERSPQMLQILIFRMLDLCVSCGMRQCYDQILDAATEVGFEPPPEDMNRPDAFSYRARDIRRDWKAQSMAKQGRTQDPAQGQTQDLQSIKVAVRGFQSRLAEQGLPVKDGIGITDVQQLLTLQHDVEGNDAKTTSHPSGGNWNIRVVKYEPDDIFRPSFIKQGRFNKETSDLKAQLEQSQEAYKLLQEKHDRENKQNDVFYQELGDLTAKYSSTLGDIEDAQKTLVSLREDHERIKTEHSNLVEEHGDLVAEHSFVMGEKEYARKALKSLKEDYENKKTEYESKLQEQSAELQRTNDEIEASRKQYESDRTEFQSKLQKQSTTLQRMDQATLDLQSYYETNQTEYESKLQEKFSDLQRMSQTTLELQVDYESKLREKTNALHQMSETVLELRNDYESKLQEQSHSSQRMNETILELQKQLQDHKTEHQKSSAGSKAREGHLKKILGIRENTVAKLRAELSELKSAHARPSQKASSPSSDRSGVDSRMSFVYHKEGTSIDMGPHKRAEQENVA